MISGNVFNIQRFSTHDGPGIRTTVFLKGCNMHCFWCHNPESHSSVPQIQVFPQKCFGCGKCVEVNPEFVAQDQPWNKIHVIDRSKANERSTEVCNADALVLTGTSISAEDVIREVEKDAHFYQISGGGVTFSGGEPMLQIPFLKALLSGCKEKGFHTTVDTAGNVDWEEFEEILPHSDLFLYDIKCMNDQRHKEVTGLGNRKILDNVKRLSSAGAKIWIRIPVIPGVNDDEEEMTKIADYIKGLNGIELVELLPFHKLGKEKYESLGMEYKADKLQPVPVDLLNRFTAIFRERGMAIYRA